MDEARKTVASDLVQLVKVTRSRAPNLPIFVMGERVTYEFSHVPAEALGDVRVMYLFEDTVPSWHAKSCARPNEYWNRLLPPYFKALVESTPRSRLSWHTPGHAAVSRSKKARLAGLFTNSSAENTLRSDLSVSVPELGSLLDHTGPRAAENNAAQPSARHTFFRDQCTSTANKDRFGTAWRPR